MPIGVLPAGTLFYRVFHDSPVGMVITTVAEGRYVEVNDAFLRLAYSRAELTDQTFTMVEGVHNQEEREMVLNVLRRVERLGNITFMLTTRDGTLWPCIASIQGEEIEGETYFIIIVQDLAQQEAAQVALQVSEDRFRLLFQGIPLPWPVVDDLNRRILDVNDAACTLYGYTMGEFTNLTLPDSGRPPTALWPASARPSTRPPSAASGSRTAQSSTWTYPAIHSSWPAGGSAWPSCRT